MTLDEQYEKSCTDLELGEVSIAFDSFKKILDENPEYYPALNKLGVICAYRGDIETAERYFEKTLDIKEDYSPALVNLANIYKEKGDRLEAEAYYKYAIENDPSYYLAYYNLAVLYKQNGNYDMYIKNMKKYKRMYKQHVDEMESSRLKQRDKLPAWLSRTSGYAVALGIMVVLLLMFGSYY